ncbi:MAG: hypothetical protein M1839_002886 [Geoglossum umbratile]|nr:MAG: hypothetical protein M1839_002886 [Geoglossum umbratile]
MSSSPHLSLVFDASTQPAPSRRTPPSATEETAMRAHESAHVAALLPAFTAAYATGPVASLCDALRALDRSYYFGGAALYGRTFIRLYMAGGQFHECPAFVAALFGGAVAGAGKWGAEAPPPPLMVFVVYGDAVERREVVVWLSDEGLAEQRPEEMLRGLFRGLAQVRGWMRMGRRVETEWAGAVEG